VLKNETALLQGTIRVEGEKLLLERFGFHVCLGHLTICMPHIALIQAGVVVGVERRSNGFRDVGRGDDKGRKEGRKEQE